MARKDPTRSPCPGKDGQECRFYARKGSEWCTNHDPALAEQRAAWGRRRNPRFVPKTVVDGAQFDRAKVPTIAQLVDTVLDVVRDVRSGELDAMQGRVMIQGLKEARETLQSERAWAQERKGDLPDDDDRGGLESLTASPMVAAPTTQ